MRPAIGYIRVSTKDQADEGVSLEVQDAKQTAWAKLNDYQMISVQQDAGLSGKRADNRPGLVKAIKLACQHKAPLVVYSLSRLARSTKDAIEILDQLRECGADLVSITEQIDTTTAAGKMVFRMLAVLAEFEREQISERTKAALGHLKAQGKCCGQVPYGWDKEADGMLVENALEQNWIGWMQLRFSQGNSFRYIADALNLARVETKSGHGIWHGKSVSTIVKAACARNKTQPITS